jgi:hypothetical protein
MRSKQSKSTKRVPPKAARDTSVADTKRGAGPEAPKEDTNGAGFHSGNPNSHLQPAPKPDNPS